MESAQWTSGIVSMKQVPFSVGRDSGVVRLLSPNLENRHCVEVEQQKSVDSKKLKEQN